MPRDVATVLKNVISIPSNSDIYRAYFQSNEFTVLSDAYAIRWVLNNTKLSPNQYLFAVQCINKVTDLSIYSYKNKLGGWNIVKNKYIQLPTKNGEIDFVFMENFIADLQAERLAELEAYLLATGLKDTTLTTEEENALQAFKSVEWKKFNVVDIFNVRNTRNILSRDIVENSGTTPYLCASAENNAVSSYISFDDGYLEKGNCIFIGGKTFVVTYQEKEFYSNDSHNLVLYVKDKAAEKSKKTQLCLVTCTNKSLGHQYSWGDSISNRKIQTDQVLLPIQNDQPDYTFMETLISAIQKLVIKDVVLYADRKITATQSVIA